MDIRVEINCNGPHPPILEITKNKFDLLIGQIRSWLVAITVHAMRSGVYSTITVLPRI